MLMLTPHVAFLVTLEHTGDRWGEVENSREREIGE